MLSSLVDWLWQWCCGFRAHRRSKLNDAMHTLERLSEEDIVKVVKFFNRNKCC